jgi:cytochrome c553
LFTFGLKYNSPSTGTPLKKRNTMNKLTFVFLAVMATASMASAQSNSAPDPLTVRSWAAGCANCHGTNGRAEPGNESLAGANKDDIVKKMLDFKAGRKPATIMHQLAKGYSDEQIVAIAGYFAAQKK